MAAMVSQVMAKLQQAWPALMKQPLRVQIAYAVLAVFVVVCRTKILMWTRGILFFILWGEKKGMSSARDSKNVVAPKVGPQEIQGKVIIFIRHGESDWNYIFNKNKLLLLPRLIMGMVWEACMFMFKNSLFIDSPLSSEGIEQAKEVQKFIANYSKKPDTPDDIAEAMKALRGDAGAVPSVLVSSNLRRAIATGCIAMWPRQQRTKEKIIVHASLQEMSRNVDTTALAGPRELPEISSIAPTLGKEFRGKKYLDVSQSTGNKGFKRKGKKSMEEFCAWCFARPEPVIIVSAGHSLWFKNFFKLYIPKDTIHHAKDLKMVNCGIVAFNLEKGVLEYDQHQTGYRVDADSMTSLWGGFEKQKGEAARPGKLKLSPKNGNSAPAKNGQKRANGKNGKETESGMCCTGRN